MVRRACGARPLADRPDYDASCLCNRPVGRDGLLTYRGAHYSVVPEQAGRLVPVKEGEDGPVRIDAGSQCVANHPLADQQGQIGAAADRTPKIRLLARAHHAEPGPWCDVSSLRSPGLPSNSGRWRTTT